MSNPFLHVPGDALLSGGVDSVFGSGWDIDTALATAGTGFANSLPTPGPGNLVPGASNPLAAIFAAATAPVSDGTSSDGASSDGTSSDGTSSDGTVSDSAVSDSAVASAIDPVSTAADQAILGELSEQLGTDATGAGITVGIMSDSFNVHGGYAADIADGALPAGVTVLKEGPASGTDEGQAMAELVHEIAPAAKIVFYTAFDGEADFASGIEALANAGCNVIVDDVTYLDEPFFQDAGAITKAVEQVVSQGVDYFTAASNEGNNYYQHSFSGLSVTLPGVLGTYEADNFGTASNPSALESLTIAKGSTCTLDLQWDQPYGASANSLGMVLYNSAGQVVCFALRDDVNGNPDQVLQFTNTTNSTSFNLAIITNGGSTVPGLFKFIVYGQGTTINDPNAGIGSGTAIGHELSPAANTVGAVNTANTPAFGGNDSVEKFSSSGPGLTLFSPNGQRLATPTSDNKVNFVAPDGTATTVFNPFFGTSAAAPVAAATAALMLQEDPTLTPAQVSAILAESAVPALGAPGTTGAGLIQADTAVKLAAAAATASHGIPAPTAAATHPTTAIAADFNSTLAALTADTSSTSDFFASISPTAAALIPDPTPANAGNLYALVDTSAQNVVSILPAQFG